MNCARSAALLALLLSASLSGAEEATVAAPDGRASVTVEGEGSFAGGHLGARGHVGGFGFDNALEGGPSGGRFTNPPFYQSYGSDGGKYEETFGPRVANATIGTGGITEGVDAYGRVTVLGWPGPGTWDHVSFVTVTRRYPNQGAMANAGSFAGIALDEPVACATRPQGGCRGSWLHPDFGWRSESQTYASGDTETLVTRLRNDALGLRVIILDVVDRDEDLVARNFRFDCLAGEGACRKPTTLVHFANMNPTTSRVPRAPSVTDAALDTFSDFATVFDPGSSAMLHFRPYQVDPAAPTRIVTGQPDVATALAAVSGAFGTGVYVAIGGQAAAGKYQAGLESGGLFRDEAESTPLADPFYDLLADGELSGSLAAFGQTAGAIGGLAPDGDGSFTVYFTAADTPAEALAILSRARARGFAAIRAESELDWQQWISRARLPATTDAETLAVSRRALMLIRTAQDRTSGAIVANATTQTPYRQDWVRDGAFFNYALLLAGYPDMALRHAEFYRKIYRTGGTWDSLYYPDGAEAGLVFPYEIDSQAFALWALWLPYELGAGDATYLEGVWPAIRDTADALLLCRDPSNGLQCYAAEDDAVQPTQGTQGASTVYLALRSAAKAVEELCAAGKTCDPEAGDRWSARADELRAAALERLCDEEACNKPDEYTGGRGGVYMVWPSRLIDPASDLAQSHLERYASQLDCWSDGACPSPLTPLAPGDYLQYPMEPILALAPVWTDPNRETRLAGWVEWLANRIPEPGVRHYGERIFYCGGAPPCEPGHDYLHTIGFPHIWSGTEMYLAAAFAHGIAGCPQNVARIGEAECRP